jgi:hypothetical protein
MLGHPDVSWIYAFTEEWPVPKVTHQLSATVPVGHIGSDGTETGLGDVLLNYRYQAVLKDPIGVGPSEGERGVFAYPSL